VGIVPNKVIVAICAMSWLVAVSIVHLVLRITPAAPDRLLGFATSYLVSQALLFNEITRRLK
jgi:hypothetical protein